MVYEISNAVPTSDIETINDTIGIVDQFPIIDDVHCNVGIMS